jgi:hypothetical protein
MALLALAFAAPSAFAQDPSAGYGEFTGCPGPEDNPAVVACLTTKITSGHFQMGSKDVPITNPMTLTGGIDEEGETLRFNSKGGLSAVKQQVPGGIIGLTGLDWLVNFLNLEGLKLYAVTELAGTVQNPLNHDPFSLPIKVHLINSVLGNNCYVGSTANPIKLQLTTGTTSPPAPNKPISGSVGTPFPDPTLPGVLRFKGRTNVDNSFAAPGASGCVLTLFGFIPISINGLVNSQSGLPAAAGTNETIQNTEGAFSPSFVVFHP